jgi:hypothetical protein
MREVALSGTGHEELEGRGLHTLKKQYPRTLLCSCDCGGDSGGAGANDQDIMIHKPKYSMRIDARSLTGQNVRTPEEA